MKDRVIRSAEVPNEGSCRVMCYMEPDCVSINVGPVEGGNQKCELNNATEENHVPFLLVNKPGFIYLAIEVKFYIFTNLRGVRHMISFHFRVKWSYSWFLILGKATRALFCYSSGEVVCFLALKWFYSWCKKKSLEKGYFLFINRIPAAVVHVWVMGPVKLDSAVKVFVVFVVMDSVEKTASCKVT